VREAGPAAHDRAVQSQLGQRANPGADGQAFDSITDAELIVRVGERDRRAFDALYRRFARPVLGLARRRLGDQGRAEEATQNTFSAVWRGARTYRPERGPGAPWLYAIARNAIADLARKPVDLVVEAADSPADEAGPAERAEREWVRRRVHRAVEELPAHERSVIALAYWSELSQSEIAERLGLPLGTVKTRTRKGLARLANLLEDEGLRPAR
jgi:RNA polymerase sigma-70 factor (ECF subfamily)